MRLRARQIVVSVIVGVRTVEQSEGNLELSTEEMAQLDETSSLHELYSYRFIDIYGQRT